MTDSKKRPLGRGVPLTEEGLDRESLPSDSLIPILRGDAQEFSPLIASLLDAKTTE